MLSTKADAMAEQSIVDMPESLTGISRLNVLLGAPTPEALQLIPERIARKYHAIPLEVEQDTLRVAMSDTGNILAVEAISAISKKRIEAVSANEADIKEAIDFNYKAFSEITEQVSSLETFSEEGIKAEPSIEAADDSPVSRTLTMIIKEAVKSRASDIHIEPEMDRIRIRYRIDGTLHDVISLPLNIRSSFLSRIKILSNMNIADHRRPQDGQFSIEAMGKFIDIRVATISTVHGEMAVLRLLDKSMGALGLSQLGFRDGSQETFEKMLQSPYGMVLISGPTGAGKTTTLYSALNSLDKVGRKIITIEDPVEYRFENINQIQVNPRAGLTFAGGLRSIVRLDPDVILVGEIRDSETAQIAIQSALTGHLVLSSIHANDTIGVIFRLIDLGVEPFLICSGVIGIVAQRLVRRICPYCGHAVTVPFVEQVAYQTVIGEEQNEFIYGAGCKACVYSGYLGRAGVFEMLQINDVLRQMLLDNSTVAQIRAQATNDGMISLAKDGMLKAKEGITTPYEVIHNAYTTTS